MDSPSAFRDEQLGRLSSHPYWVRRRRNVCAAATAAAAAMLVVLGLLSVFSGWLDPQTGQSTRPWMLLLLALTSLTGGAAGTLAGLTQLALWQNPDVDLEPEAGEQRGKRPALSRRAGRRTAPSARPPAWFVDLKRELGGSGIEAERLEPPEAETSASSGRSELAMLFGGRPPTGDQAEAFERFADLFRRGLQADEVCCDLLVEGPAGAGKTTTLLACAAYAALVRGQRVLWIAPDSLRREAILARMQQFLSTHDLAPYVKAAPVSGAGVNSWLTQNEPIPHLLIGTVDTVEQDFYGFDCARSDLNKLRRLVQLPQVIVVDDVLQFEDPQRQHLAFLIDKHRLLAAAEHTPFQLLTACRSLSPLGEQALAGRLFTVRHFDRAQNLVPLRPPAGAKAWRVHWHGEGAAETLDRLVRWCLSKRLDVLLYERGLDDRGQAAMVDKYGPEAAGRLTVIGDLDRPLAASAPLEVDAVFFQEAQHADICLALRLHAGRDDTIIFSIAPAPQAAPPAAAAGVVPVLAGRQSAPLSAAHLAGAARLLRPLAPVPLDAWLRFGLQTGAARTPQQGDQRLAPRWRLDQWEEHEYPAEVWPFISVDAHSPARLPVKTAGLPEPNWSLFVDDDGRTFSVGRHAIAPAEAHESGEISSGRRAVWYDGETPLPELGAVDLAHAAVFRAAMGSRSLGLRTIRRDVHGPVRLIGDFWHGGGQDRCLPVYDLEWSIPAGLSGGRFFGGRGDGLRWFELEGPPIHVDVRIIGHMAIDGRATDVQAVPFSYPAHAGGLLLSPSQIEPDQLAELVARGLEGRWQIDDPHYWGALTGAVNYALAVQMPGFHHFARSAAFELVDDARSLAAAVVWIIEPTSSGRTGGRTFSHLLHHPAPRRSFLELAAWYLEQAAGDSGDYSRYQRRAIHMGFKGDDRVGNAAGALKLIEAVV